MKQTHTQRKRRIYIHIYKKYPLGSTWIMRRLPQDKAPMCSPHTSYRWRGERVIEPIKCMRSPHTSYRWRGERVIEPIKCLVTPFKRLIHSGTKHVIAQSQRRKTVFGIIFVVEIEQKQAIWCLKRKSLN